MNIVIVAGGDISDRFIPDIRKADMVIGADRGAHWLIERRIPLDLAIGDFDSVSEAEKRRIRNTATSWKEFPAYKDATDLELAADEAIRMKPKIVMIYGALGGRFDHSVGALHTLSKLMSYNIYGEIVDNSHKIMIVRHKQVFTKDLRLKYVSIFPFGSGSAEVTLSGFKYDTDHCVLLSDSSRGISNEICGSKATLVVHGSTVLVVRSSG